MTPDELKDWHEAFDCDVESDLDKITSDEKIRGQIRYRLVKLSDSLVRTEAKLRSELAELRKDKERLEFLMENAPQARIVFHADGECYVHGFFKLGYFKTPREAIDASMEAEKR